MSSLLNLFRYPVQFYFSRLFPPLRSKCSTLDARLCLHCHKNAQNSRKRESRDQRPESSKSFFFVIQHPASIIFSSPPAITAATQPTGNVNGITKLSNPRFFKFLTRLNSPILFVMRTKFFATGNGCNHQIIEANNIPIFF